MRNNQQRIREEVTSEEEGKKKMVSPKFNKEVWEFNWAFSTSRFFGITVIHCSVLLALHWYSDKMRFIICLHHLELFFTFRTESILLRLLQNSRFHMFVGLGFFLRFFSIWLNFWFCLLLDWKLLIDKMIGVWVTQELFTLTSVSFFMISSERLGRFCGLYLHGQACDSLSPMHTMALFSVSITGQSFQKTF